MQEKTSESDKQRSSVSDSGSSEAKYFFSLPPLTLIFLPLI